MDTDSFTIHIQTKDIAYKVYIVYTKTLHMLLEKDLTHHIMELKDHYQKVKVKN